MKKNEEREIERENGKEKKKYLFVCRRHSHLTVEENLKKQSEEGKIDIESGREKKTFFSI